MRFRPVGLLVAHPARPGGEDAGKGRARMWLQVSIVILIGLVFVVRLISGLRSR